MGFPKLGEVLDFIRPCRRQTMLLALNSIKHPPLTPQTQKLKVIGAFKVSAKYVWPVLKLPA